jgi:DNA gyrase subunit A
MGRNTQGVRLISLTDGETLVGIERVIDDSDDSEESSAVDDASGE